MRAPAKSFAFAKHRLLKPPCKSIAKRMARSRKKIIQVEPEVADLFLGGSEVNGEGAALLPGGAAEARDPGVRTVLFTDIVDSTSLTQKCGDDMAMEFLRVHDRIVRDALAAAKGREVKH